MLWVCKFPSPNTNICRKYQRQRGRETERRDMELFPDKYKHLQTRNKQPAITSPAMDCAAYHTLLLVCAQLLVTDQGYVVLLSCSLWLIFCFCCFPHWSATATHELLRCWWTQLRIVARLKKLALTFNVWSCSAISMLLKLVLLCK